jgi:hypothetical protein
MRTKRLPLLFAGSTILFVLSTLTPQLSASPMGTAFSYQGRLSSGTNAANGLYDLRFGLCYTATSPPVPLVQVTNTATTVTNGYFTVTLDFGNWFSGNAFWLEIGVRSNGSGAFTTLSPRQPLTPTPYAMFAPWAGIASTVSGGIPASQITGTISSNNIATGSITGPMLASGTVGSEQLAANLTVSGTLSAARFEGNGALPWQVVAGTAQLAAPNTGYVLTNGAPVTVTLPGMPNLGDVVHVSGVGAGGWQVAPNSGQTIIGLDQPAGVTWTPRETNRLWRGVASSADGSKLAAIEVNGQIYTSTDAGKTWTPRETNRAWMGVASSADGTKLVAVCSPGRIFTSIDSGVTWTPRDSDRAWTSVASSTSGTKLVATVAYGSTYTSTDSGLTWVPHVLQTNWLWRWAASSADGTKLVTVSIDPMYANTGRIYVSADSGLNWSPRGPGGTWFSAASSADGTKLVASGQVDGYYTNYTSSDSGMSWIPRVRYVAYALASSADGNRLLSAGYDESSGSYTFCTSTDSGVTWTVRQTNQNRCLAVASSTNGSRLVAAVENGQIYTSEAASSLPGVQGTTVALQYIGNGQWQPMKESQITAGTLTTGELGVNSVQTENIAAGAVTAVKLAAGAVGTAQLADNSVASAQIQDGTITDADVSSTGIGGNKIVGGDLRASRLQVGQNHTLSGDYATIAGGSGNAASSYGDTVGGGETNTASGGCATVPGGYGNMASGPCATVAGGEWNIASGVYATVAGGIWNEARGGVSFAAGYRAKALHTGSFVWGDSTYANVASSADNQFIIRASGGVGIGTTNPAAALDVVGDLKVSGAYKGNIGPNNGAPFPRPAYDSGWVAIGQGEIKTLTHNVGGNVDNYVVDMQFRADAVVHNIGLGGRYQDYGASWECLSSNQIWILRAHDDLDVFEIRIRIWVYN